MKEILTWFFIAPILLFLVRLVINILDRDEIDSFRISALATLATEGETEARKLRNLANKAAGTKIGTVRFYGIMAQMEQHGQVTSRCENKEVNGIIIRVIFYKITPRGRKTRIKKRERKIPVGVLGGPEPQPA